MTNDTRLTLHEVRGPLNDLVGKLSGLRGQEWLVALQRMLRKENPWPEPGKPRTWNVWKTIRLSIGNSGKELYSELEEKDFRIGDWACDMLKQKAFTVATQEEDVDLVNLSVADLGFKEGARYDAICTRAVELGLELCPAEVGPQLRLQYPDQPRDEWFTIAMEAILGSSGDLHVFGVECDEDGRWLRGSYGRPVYFWHADDRFVFRLRKPGPCLPAEVSA